mmetsp:Transcript_16554/g.55914  ORF Transcript_16554/g.55914 Transcript_16554/m.55914 type:complete len:315 (-) Transcript_16554:198-1142(-)
MRPLRVPRHALLGQTKVGEADVAALIEEHVLRFEVSVYHPEAVHVLQRQRQFGDVEPRARLGELAELLQMAEQLAAGAVVQNEEKLVPRLERSVHAHDKGVVHVAQHRALRPRVLHLVALHDVFLFQNLHGENAPRRRLPNKEDLAEGALANHSDGLEIGNAGWPEALALELGRGGGGGAGDGGERGGRGVLRRALLLNGGAVERAGEARRHKLVGRRKVGLLQRDPVVALEKTVGGLFLELRDLLRPPSGRRRLAERVAVEGIVRRQTRARNVLRVDVNDVNVVVRAVVAVHVVVVVVAAHQHRAVVFEFFLK